MSLEGYKIKKILNNNVVLATQHNDEKILFSKGIGFTNNIGDIVPNGTKIEKVFSIEDKDNSTKFDKLVSTVDNEIIGISEEIIYMVGQELNEELDEKIHIALADHIAFTLNRLTKNDEIFNPFLVETETLYKKEFEIAKKATSLIEKRTKIEIPEGEIGFIALHIHSARNRGKLSNTIKYAYLSSSIVEIIEDELGMTVDKNSLDYARFVIHIRFAIERLINNIPIKNVLLKTIKERYKKSYKLAQKVCKFIESELDVTVSEDEVGYIAVYIEELKNATRS